MPERLDVICSTAELESFVPRWKALWKIDSHATPFQSPDWLVPWWHCFGQELRTVCIYRDNELIGVLPFYLYRQPVTGGRQLLPLGVGTSDYLDGIFAPQCSVESIRNALEVLCQENDWDELHLSQLRPRSRLLYALRRSERPGDSTINTQDCSRMSALPIAELPQKIRRNAMYYRNRAQRAGNLEFIVADASTWEENFEALHRLSTERWRSRGQAGVFADERVIRWHREAIPLLESAGLLRMCTLRLNGDIVGVLYSLIDSAGREERNTSTCRPTRSGMGTCGRELCSTRWRLIMPLEKVYVPSTCSAEKKSTRGYGILNGRQPSAL